MTKQTIQKVVVHLIGGILAGAITFYLLKLIPFYPQSVRQYISLGVGVLWLINPLAGEIAALGILVIPITYTSLTLTIILLMVLLIVAVFDAWSVGPYGFLLFAAAVILVQKRELNFLLFIIPLLAGFLGPRRGALAGAFSAFLALALGVIMGRSHIGMMSVYSEGIPVVHLKLAPIGKLFGTGWFVDQTKAGIVDTGIFNAVLSPFGDHFVMLLQIALWALAAGLVGLFLSKRLIKRVPSTVIAITAGAVILTAGFFLLDKAFPTAPWQMEKSWRSTLIPFGLVLLTSPAFSWFVPILTPIRKEKSGFEVEKTAQWTGNEVLEKRKKEIKKITDAQFNPSGRNTDNSGNGVIPRGILFFGPQGTEKTKLARSIADEVKASLISVSRNTLNAKYHDVFISYSTRDKIVADTCVELLEKNKIRCWYAPRNIEPGADWGKEVTNAINNSKMVVLIFSSNSNRSQRVLDEINYAISQGMDILPFRIENIAPNDTLSLHLSSRHWLDAYKPSWKEYLETLHRLISGALEDVTVAKETSTEKDDGNAANYLKQVFNDAQKHRPSILFFEELSDFVSKAEVGGDGSANAEITDVFLECIDHLANNPGVLILAATEYPEKIDEVVFEGSRLGVQYYIPPPDQETCRSIIRDYLEDKPVAFNLDFNKLAGMMKGYSLADIHAIGDEASAIAESTRGTRQKPLDMAQCEMIIKSRKPVYSAESLSKYEVFAAEHSGKK